MIGGYQLVIKTRPASSSYGMLTGSVIWGLVRISILSDNSLLFYWSLYTR